MIMFNPGTGGRPEAKVENADAIVERICADLKIPRDAIARITEKDQLGRGYFAYAVALGEVAFEIDVPGDDPDAVCAGETLQSRRLYVDGSSWYYGYALNRIQDRLTLPHERTPHGKK